MVSPVSYQIPSGVRMAQVACGSQHVLLRTNDGKLYAQGKGPQTGLGEEQVFSPKILLSGVEFIAAGEEHSLAIVKSEKLET